MHVLFLIDAYFPRISLHEKRNLLTEFAQGVVLAGPFSIRYLAFCHLCQCWQELPSSKVPPFPLPMVSEFHHTRRIKEGDLHLKETRTLPGCTGLARVSLFPPCSQNTYCELRDILQKPCWIWLLHAIQSIWVTRPKSDRNYQASALSSISILCLPAWPSGLSALAMECHFFFPSHRFGFCFSKHCLQYTQCCSYLAP